MALVITAESRKSSINDHFHLIDDVEVSNSRYRKQPYKKHREKKVQVGEFGIMNAVRKKLLVFSQSC